jgi:CNT family concentrative nucleoside transporter
MTGGFATVAGGIMAAYVVTLSDYFPNIAGHLLAASVMAAPGSLVMAKIILPETNKPETLLSSNIVVKRDSNILDSAAKGTSDGLYLALNIGAMLIAFLSLITLLNLITSTTASWLGFDNLTLEKIFGYLFSPIAFVLGVAWEDSKIIGSLFATKIIINELVAYIKLSEYLGNGTIMSAKSIIVSTYALCGFANFTSIGIQIGGLSALAPNRRKDFARLGFKAMIAGSLACFQTAAIVGVLL